MPTEVTMPKMGYDMEEGTILAWHKAEGDNVAKGDILGEIETGKVNIEIEAFDAGTLLKIAVGEGETVPVGTPIAFIGQPGEEVPESADARAEGSTEKDGASAGDGQGSKSAGGPGSSSKSRAETAGIRQDGAPAATAATDGASANGSDGRLRASPLARRVAAEHDLDLSAVSGSGPHGRVVRDDVEAAIASGAGGAVEPTAGAAVPQEAVHEPMSRMRRTIATRLSESWRAAPHIFLTMAIELDEALALRKQVNASLAASGRDTKASVNDLVVKAAAVALRAHPKLNVSWDDGARAMHQRVNVGVAVALEDGLMTVTVPDADTKGLAAIAEDVRDKATRAREGRLTPADMEVPSTFTVSNLGMYGIEDFTAIINPPEAAILAVGAGVPTPVVRDGEVVVRTVLKVTLSADHRVVDGATAAEYLVTLRDLLQNPLSLLV